jgi:hypothetical protein
MLLSDELVRGRMRAASGCEREPAKSDGSSWSVGRLRLMLKM